MNVASLELCKELYELSGWKQAKDGWLFWSNSGQLWTRLALNTGDADQLDYPAYDLGYLLRKLPTQISVRHNDNGDWHCIFHQGVLTKQAVADTPEDAAAKLAIELFKSGVLTKEGNHGA